MIFENYSISFLQFKQSLISNSLKRFRFCNAYTLTCALKIINRSMNKLYKLKAIKWSFRIMYRKWFFKVFQIVGKRKFEEGSKYFGVPIIFRTFVTFDMLLRLQTFEHAVTHTWLRKTIVVVLTLIISM